MTAELMARAQAGDVDAFAELYAQHYGFVLRYVAKRHPDRAEELTQDTFVKALASLHQWRDQGKDPRAWLTTIAARLCIDRAKSADYRLTEPVGQVPDIQAPSRRTDPAALALANLDRREVLTALLQVSDPQRVALVGFYLRGMSIRQLSVQMGSPENAVRQVLHRGRRAMAQLLAGVDRA